MRHVPAVAMVLAITTAFEAADKKEPKPKLKGRYPRSEAERRRWAGKQ